MTARYPIEMVNGVPVVAVPEEIDIRNAGWLRAVVLEAAARGHETFVVDMTRTHFCDSAGLGVLVRAHCRALAEGGELRLVIPASAMVVRVFALSGIDQVIPNFPSLYEAVVPASATAPPATAPTAALQAPHAHPSKPASARPQRARIQSRREKLPGHVGL
jgi:anti-sigma B factor antagonist